METNYLSRTKKPTADASNGHAESSGTERPANCSAANQPEAQDSKVSHKPTRRYFSGGYKLRILCEANQCERPGQLGALLKREGLYSSHLSSWRRQQQAGMLAALTPKKRGRKTVDPDTLVCENRSLHRENEHLQARLRQAEMIIQMQGGVSSMPVIPEIPSGKPRGKGDCDGEGK